MGVRYVTRAQARYSVALDDDVQDHGLTVFEADDEPTDTGLLDSTGAPLYRVHDRKPIGFDTSRVQAACKSKSGKRKGR